MGRGVGTLGKCGMNGICVEKYRVSGMDCEFLLVYGDREFAGEQVDKFQLFMKVGRDAGRLLIIAEKTAERQKTGGTDDFMVQRWFRQSGKIIKR